MIGLRVSLCVADIVHGSADIRSVEKIIDGTTVRNRKDLDDFIHFNRGWKWVKNLDQCERIARLLFTKNMVEQPRLYASDDACFPLVGQYGNHKHAQVTNLYRSVMEDMRWEPAGDL